MGDTGSGHNDAARADHEENGIRDTDDSAEGDEGEGDADDQGNAVTYGSNSDQFGYEIAGGVVAWLGFIFTPLVTAAPASYLALKVRESNPGAYYGILAVVAATCVFWLLVVFAADLLALVLALFTGSSLLVVLLGVPVLVLLVVVAGVVYLWRE